MSIAFFQEQYPNDTVGESAVAGNMIRLLNTQIENTIVGCVLNSATGVVTLPEGNYKISAIAVAPLANKSQLTLMDADTNSALLNGLSYTLASSGPQSQLIATCEGPLTITATANINLTHFQAGAAVLGRPVSSGQPEVYSQLIIETA